MKKKEKKTERKSKRKLDQTNKKRTRFERTKYNARILHIPETQRKTKLENRYFVATRNPSPREEANDAHNTLIKKIQLPDLQI
jgi:hypothetical protein